MKNIVNRAARLQAARIAGWKRGVGRKLLPPPRPLEFIVYPERVMWAQNEFHSGQAVWRYSLGEWICASASDCLAFLVKCTAKDGKFELAQRGYRWEWH